MNGVILKFGKDNDQQGFFIKRYQPQCDSKMKTAFVGIQNAKVVSSICKSTGDEYLAKMNFHRERTLLTLGYTLSNFDWGKVYYKIYRHEKYFHNAQQQCKNDGTSLPVPRSGLFNLENLHMDNIEEFKKLLSKNKLVYSFSHSRFWHRSS